MSKGVGRVERAIILALFDDGPLTINDLAITTAGLKGVGILELPCKSSSWQSAARAVRSLVRKGLVVECGSGGGKKLYKSS